MSQHYIPCLPNRAILTPDLPAVSGYTLEQMQAERKQAWEAAMEEAAQVSERGFQYGHDGNAIADAIRSLK